MADLFWPGDARAGDHFSQGLFMGAMVAVEQAWLDVLVDGGVAPEAARGSLEVETDDLTWLMEDSELGGNAVVGLLEMLREHHATGPETAHWLHRGLTSQDVIDSALMWSLRGAVTALLADMLIQISTLSTLAAEHRRTVMVARTLTRHAVPTTFGLKAATWLSGVLDAYDDVGSLTFPVQLGGAAGTMAAGVELGLDPATARTRLADRLGLADAPPWHTTRSAVTRAGDALVRCTDAWGRLANDVLTLSRPGISELAEGVGGRSSTMPHKANPILSVQVRRASLTTPQLAATLHLAAAAQVDERADGGWHAEWATIRDLARRTLVAGSQTAELLTGLQVHPDRMAATLESDREDVLSEQRRMAELSGHAPTGDYLGEADALINAVLDRAQRHLEPSR